MSPATELRTAATTLRERVAAFRAEVETNSYWTLGYEVGTNNAMGGAGGELAATFTPELAEGLAAWLETEALMWEERGNSVEGQTFHALKAARDINGTVAPQGGDEGSTP